jgi:hypothetical protein
LQNDELLTKQRVFQYQFRFGCVSFELEPPTRPMVALVGSGLQVSTREKEQVKR